jgi:DNA repair photolyase
MLEEGCQEACMIISASRRTDIPACYPTWLMNRLRAGYCIVSNPFNPRQIRRVSLLRQDVDAIVFWTKNVRPLLPSIDELISAGHRFMVQFTINPYPSILEPGLPPLDHRIADFKALGQLIGKSRVIWRYDPIIISNQTPFSYHRERFYALAKQLSSFTERVVVSVVQLYRKTLRGLMGLRKRGLTPKGIRDRKPLFVRQRSLIFEQHAADSAEMSELLSFFARTANEYGLEIVSCASQCDLRLLGIAPGRCIDGELLTRLWGLAGPWKKDPGQRPACGCRLSVDIGATNTCQNGCPYCYATTNHEQARIQFLRHDSHAETLDFSSRCSSK